MDPKSLKFDEQVYIHKLNANELGYRNGESRRAGRFILIAKSCIRYFPPLSEVVLNDHVLLDIIPPFSDNVVLTNYIYHNSYYATSDKKESRNEYRVYLNSKNDVERNYFKPKDIILLVKIHQEENLIYKILRIQPNDEEYVQVNKILAASSPHSKSNALVERKNLSFLDGFRKITIGIKIIPPEVIDESFKEPINDVAVSEEDADDTTRVLRSKSFRDLVLYFYDFKCAITEKKLFIDHKDFNNLEAAHIHARSAGGGSNPANGMALERNLHWAAVANNKRLP